MATAYWKQFVGWVTDSVYKYQFDPFFRTSVNIVALQVAKLLFLLAVIGIAASSLYYDASKAVTDGITQAIANPHASPDAISNAIVAQLTTLRWHNWVEAGLLIILITLIFSYMITRLALTPVRNALESQKQFIGNVAHELRTPLAILKTNMEVALMAQERTAEMETTLKSNIEELDRASEIINNLLSLSASIRPERIEFTDVDLGAVIRTVIQNMHIFAEKKNIQFEARMSERRDVWGNATALEQIAINIIKNAITYSPPRGRIFITIEPVYPNFMELRIRDAGIGIRRKDLFRIFEPYFRSEPSRKRGPSGSGLGLTIVAELVKLHNGRISVRSAEGRGTTVTILFPAGRSDHMVDGISESRQDNVSEVGVNFSSEESEHYSS